MTGIPPNIYNQLRQALLDCGPFASDAQLMAVFAHPKLRPWRHSVPQASNPAARVDATIALLAEKHRVDTKENALVLLLRVLSDQIDTGDERHHQLATLADELERTMTDSAPSAHCPTTPGGMAQPSSPTLPTDMPKPEPVQVGSSLASASTGETKGEKPQTTEKKDFFISYNRHDKQWAEWIAWQLEEAGYTTIIQAWDFRPGGNFVADMQRAAAQAERTIAVLSPDYLASRFTQPEWHAAFAQDPTGEQSLLLPVRVRECELKGLLPQIVYIDLVGLDSDAAREALLAGVKRGRAKPLSSPGFPGTVKPFLSEQPDFPGESSSD